MAHSVFWSWQSDHPARVSRTVIRDALVLALERISADVEEAARPEIDHDTKGVPGSPPIADTILEKIESASVFVGDVTPIAVSARGKHVANPNVLIELGYAKRALGPERVITVWNTALSSATIEDLPFDMRHRRGPIEFHLPIEAGTPEIREVRARLSRHLEAAVKACLGALPAPVAPALPWHPAEPDDPSRWEGSDQSLVIAGAEGSLRLAMATAPCGYARMLPSEWEARPDYYDVLDGPATHPVPLGSYGGLDFGKTQGGFIAFRSSPTIREKCVTPTATRAFKSTGEFWGIADGFFYDLQDRGSRFRPDATYEGWSLWLESNGRLCRHLGGRGPFHIRLGLEGLKGTFWEIGRREDEGIYEAMEPRLVFELNLDEITPDGIKMALRGIFDRIREAYGLRPMEDWEVDRLVKG